MVAFNIEASFAAMAQDGRVVQTMCPYRRCNPGDTMQVYTGMGSAACKLLRRAPCILVDYCHLEPEGIVFGNKDKHPDANAFAHLSGFADYAKMHAWFRRHHGTHHYVGHIHRWSPTALAA